VFRRVVVVLVDGLRGDAITIEHMPSLYELGMNFVRAGRATTVRPSTTVAALTSLATGVAPDIHGWTGVQMPALSPLARIEPLPRVLRHHGRSVSVVAQDLPFIRRSMARALTTLAGAGRLHFADPDPRRLAEAAIVARERTATGLIMVYLQHCDRAGHEHGWMSPAYLQAASQADKAIGVLASMLAHDLLVVLSDHGGGGVSARDHDALHPLNERIPLVLASQRLPRSVVIRRRVSLLDVPVTIAEALGVPVPSSYQGRSLIDRLTPREAVPA